MARPLKPLVRGGGFYPSKKWTPLVYAGGYTTANGGEEPTPPPIEKTVIGNPIHITDALAKPAQALSVKLEPIQDLHGYDHPWPAGGGKNLANVNDAKSNSIHVSVTKTETTAGSIIVGVCDDTGTYRSMYIDIPAEPLIGKTLTMSGKQEVSNDAPYSAQIRAIINESSTTLVASYNENFSISAVIPSCDYVRLFFTVTGGTAAQGATKTITNLMLNEGSTALPWQPYSNICPISGHTDADVVRTGVNVWDGVTESGYINVNTGEELSSESQRRSLFVSCKPSTNYVYVNTNAASGVRIAFYDGAKNYAGMFSNNNSNPQSFTTPQNAKYLRFYWGDTSGISINYPSTATDYEPYVGTTYPIPLGQTVYGGTLDVVTGVLTVDMALFSKKFSELLDSTGNVPEGYALKSSGMLSVQGDYSNRTKALCNMASFNDSSNGKNVFRMTSSGNYLYFTLPTDLDSDTVITSCYPLATPIEITLTPTQIEMLLGENNLWADAGDLTLTYLADGNASEIEALNILLGGRYVNNHTEDEPTDREALDILLGGNTR